MYELCQVSDTFYYIDNPTKIGIIKMNEKDIILIDSGSNKEVGRKIRQIIDKQEWNLQCIVNTHSHADHIGGNNYLQKQKKCKIYAPDTEMAFVNNPKLEPDFLYGGNAPNDLQHKFLMAEASVCELLTENVLPDNVDILDLGGHCFNMVGFKMGNVVYLADSLWSRTLIDKYPIFFLYDVAKMLETLEKIKNIDGDIFVPSHGEVLSSKQELIDLVDINVNQINKICSKVVEICSEPINFDELLKRIFCEFNMEMDFTQYALVGSTIKSYLNYLKLVGDLEVVMCGNCVLWKKVC